MEKILNQKNFHYFFWTPLSLHLDEFLPPVSFTPVANLTPESTTLAKLVAKFATCVVDTAIIFILCCFVPYAEI
jgi:hypothetical protein